MNSWAGSLDDGPVRRGQLPGKLLLVAVLLGLAMDSASLAANVVYNAPKPLTFVLPGAWAAVSAASVSNPQGLTDFYNDGTNFSYPVALDTGASGMLMSWTVQTTFSVPLTGGTYSDVGIGGTETFNVTQPLNAYLAPTNVNPDVVSNFTKYGTFTYEAKQKTVFEENGQYFDVVGTPVLKNYVMHVKPNSVTDLISSGVFANFANAHLLNAMPKLPSKGVLRVPLTYKNFVSGSPAISTNENPVVQGVSASAGSKTQGYTSNWLLDTGSSLTMVTPTLAHQIGIDTSAAPVTQTTVEGVGNNLVTMDGYEVNTLSIPLSTGDHLVFHNLIVFVPETNYLPSSLTGVLGMNLFDPSASTYSLLTGEPTDQIASPFSDFYVNSIAANPQLILVDPNSSYAPEPASLAVLTLGALLLLCQRQRVRPVGDRCVA